MMKSYSSSNRGPKGLSTTIFNILNYGFFTIISVMTIYPFLNVIAKSFSNESFIAAGKVYLLPKGFHIEAYKAVLSQRAFFDSAYVSLFVTIVGSFMGLLITAFTAYPLSRSHLIGKKTILLIYIFTTIFSGGIIPTYLLVRSLNLTNTIWSQILPNIVVVYYMLVMKSYFETIPESLEETSKIDGCSNIMIFFKIILPLSTPVIATITLFYAVYYWNNFFNAMIYVTNRKLYPLQLYLREMLLEAADVEELYRDPERKLRISTEMVRSANIIVITLPILLVYPYLQKYFIKGIMIGSIKE